jgi:TetR/AcrR family transcriptional regulator, regulator of autoinduction and epiphytic fitness
VDQTAEDPRVERSRRVVRQAALAELAEAGYGAFTIESVAARAGVGKSTIYRHWRDKAELIADAFQSAHEHAVPDVTTGSARQRVTRLVRHVAEIVGNPMFSRCIPALIEGAERDARVGDFRARFAAACSQRVTEIVAEGARSGEFSAGTNAELATLALVGAIFYQRLLLAGQFDPGRAHELVDAVLPHSD